MAVGKRLCVFLFVGLFFYDAFVKLMYTESEADKLRSRFSAFKQFSQRQLGVDIPIEYDIVAMYKEVAVITLALF